MGGSTGVASAAGRLIFSWASDRIGRKNAIYLIIAATLVGVLALIVAQGFLFMVCVALIAFAFGGCASVFPALAFGRRRIASCTVARPAPPMTPSLSTQPLSEREIDELEDVLLALPEDRGSLDVSMLDGFLVGVLLQHLPGALPAEPLSSNSQEQRGSRAPGARSPPGSATYQPRLHGRAGVASQGHEALLAPLPEQPEGSHRFTPPVPRSLEEMDPAVPGLSYILYTCIFVPRLPSHYLTGDLAAQLSRWTPEICLAYGWRLDGIATRPDYFQCTVRVAPSVSPGNIMRVLRQQTSQRIFGFNSTYKEQNPSGDFWAPGYLVISGSQPPAGDLLRDFLQETRHRQGLSSQ